MRASLLPLHRTPGRAAGALAWLTACLAATVSLPPDLTAQNATATLQYDVRGFLPPAPVTPLQPVRDDCNGTFTFNASAFGQNAGSSYLPPAPFTGTCDLRNTAGTPLAFGGRAEVFSYARRPDTFDPANPSDYRLAQLGARAEIVSELRQWDPNTGLAPAGEPSTGRWSASATATFADFLRVVDPTDPTIRVNRLALEFELSGNFSIGPFAGAGGFGGASAGFTLFATPQFNAPSALYSRTRSQSGPDATVGRGEVTSSQSEGAITESLGACSSSSAATCTRVRLEIGPAFFDVIGQAAITLFDSGIPIPPSVSNIELQLALTASVNSADVAYLNLFGNTLNERTTRADFANTLSFVSVQAFDANDEDITSVLRFASLGDPLPPDGGDHDTGDDDGGTGTPPSDPNPPTTAVPEPGSVVLLAVGLGGLHVVTRRRGTPRI